VFHAIPMLSGFVLSTYLSGQSRPGTWPQRVRPMMH